MGPSRKYLALLEGSSLKQLSESWEQGQTMQSYPQKEALHHENTLVKHLVEVVTDT